jgi:hypothetical protein
VISVVFPTLRYFCRACFYDRHRDHVWFNCECPVCTTQTTPGQFTDFRRPAVLALLNDGTES